MITIDSFKRKNVLVVGDVMLDIYFRGKVNRISPEAPVPVFNKVSERQVLGGAANVAFNLIAAGQNATIVSVIGNDSHGHDLISLLNKNGISSKIISVNDRKTTTKTRFLASNNQQVMRLDDEDDTIIREDLAESLMSVIAESIDTFDIVLLSDYLKGVLTPFLCRRIIDLCNSHNIPVVIDVKDRDTTKYSNATLLKPNLKELHDLTGLPVDNKDAIIAAAQFLKEQCHVKYVLCTCGAKGMVLLGDGLTPYSVNAEDREVFDVSGAGDTTIAYLAAGMANRIDMTESVWLANKAAGIQVGKLGTAAVYLSELDDCMSNKPGNNGKILGKSELKDFRRTNLEKTIVFTNGCFDILHIGHKRYLEKAAALGDLLVIGVNSDDSVKRLKGNDRPVNNEQDRLELLTAFPFVDKVVLFSEDTPYEIIEDLQPDILVKGGDYLPEEVVGRDIVEGRGGKLILIDFVEGRSTTNVIKKIKNGC